MRVMAARGMDAHRLEGAAPVHGTAQGGPDAARGGRYRAPEKRATLGRAMESGQAVAFGTQL